MDNGKANKREYIDDFEKILEDLHRLGYKIPMKELMKYSSAQQDTNSISAEESSKAIKVEEPSEAIKREEGILNETKKLGLVEKLLSKINEAILGKEKAKIVSDKVKEVFNDIEQYGDKSAKYKEQLREIKEKFEATVTGTVEHHHNRLLGLDEIKNNLKAEKLKLNDKISALRSKMAVMKAQNRLEYLDYEKYLVDESKAKERFNNETDPKLKQMYKNDLYVIHSNMEAKDNPFLEVSRQIEEALKEKEEIEKKIPMIEAFKRGRTASINEKLKEYRQDKNNSLAKLEKPKFWMKPIYALFRSFKFGQAWLGRGFKGVKSFTNSKLSEIQEQIESIGAEEYEEFLSRGVGEAIKADSMQEVQQNLQYQEGNIIAEAWQPVQKGATVEQPKQEGAKEEKPNTKGAEQPEEPLNVHEEIMKQLFDMQQRIAEIMELLQDPSASKYINPNTKVAKNGAKNINPNTKVAKNGVKNGKQTSKVSEGRG